MSYKNPKALLDAATALPAAIEAKLPAGAPKISTQLLAFNSKLPVLPDFPMRLPALPAIPTLPAMPGAPVGAGLGRYVTRVEVVPVTAAPTPVRSPVTPLEQAYTQPIEGVVGTVTSRRGM